MTNEASMDGKVGYGRPAMTSPTDARILEALLRADFRAFVHKAFATLSPGQLYIST